MAFVHHHVHLYVLVGHTIGATHAPSRVGTQRVWIVACGYLKYDDRLEYIGMGVHRLHRLFAFHEFIRPGKGGRERKDRFVEIHEQTNDQGEEGHGTVRVVGYTCEQQSTTTRHNAGTWCDNILTNRQTEGEQSTATVHAHVVFLAQALTSRTHLGRWHVQQRSASRCCQDEYTGHPRSYSRPRGTTTVWTFVSLQFVCTGHHLERICATQSQEERISS